MEPTSETSPKPKTTADGERLHQLRLTRGAILLARIMIAQPGWSKSHKATRKGVKLLRLLPKQVEPKDADEERKDAWATEVIEIEAPEALRKIGADCIGHFQKQGAFGATEAVDNLLTEFGVVDEE